MLGIMLHKKGKIRSLILLLWLSIEIILIGFFIAISI